MWKRNMVKGKPRPYAVILVLLAIVACAFVYTYSIGRQTGRGSRTGNSTRFNQSFCLNAVQNSTAVLFSISNGTSCFRIDVRLNYTEAGFVSNMSAHGADFLGILDYDTVGAHPSGTGCVAGCNWTLDTWNSSVREALKEYPEIHEWEIYNEPLVSNFASGYENGSARDYFNMIKSAYAIIKSTEPNATIVCFGGAQLFPVSAFEYEYPFYKKVWEYGASKYCSAVSLHIYSLPYYSLSQQVAPGVTLEEEYNYTLYSYENMTGKPVWITETGIPSNNGTDGLSISESNQASFLYQDFSFLASRKSVSRVYWFHLVGDARLGNDYGLLNRTTLRPKPAWGVFLYFARNGTMQ